MITAKEARELAGPTPEEIVKEELEQVFLKIKDAAENKNRNIVLYDNFWTRGGYNSTKEYQAAVSILEGVGYDVKFHYEERQFVNMYTKISW